MKSYSLEFNENAFAHSNLDAFANKITRMNLLFKRAPHIECFLQTFYDRSFPDAALLTLLIRAG